MKYRVTDHKFAVLGPDFNRACCEFPAGAHDPAVLQGGPVIHVSFELSNKAEVHSQDMPEVPAVGDQVVFPNETFPWTVKRRRWGLFEGETVVVLTVA